MIAKTSPIRADAAELSRYLPSAPINVIDSAISLNTDTGTNLNWDQLQQSASRARTNDDVRFAPFAVFVSFKRAAEEDLSTYTRLEESVTAQSDDRVRQVAQSEEFEVVPYNWTETNYISRSAAKSYSG